MGQSPFGYERKSIPVAGYCCELPLGMAPKVEGADAMSTNLTRLAGSSEFLRFITETTVFKETCLRSQAFGEKKPFRPQILSLSCVRSTPPSPSRAVLETS